MAIDYTKRTPFLTEDGSASLQLTEVTEQYHSRHGALNESRHIYIGCGLRHLPESAAIKILEVGFGTGLNALLTLAEKRSGTIEYTTLEPFPLLPNEVEMLNYPQLIAPELAEDFRLMHQIPASEKCSLSPNFTFLKHHTTIENAVLPDSQFDLVYFDLFGPDVEPELWKLENFQKIFQSMKPQSILVTYCAKGIVKRTLKAAGFQIESMPGPVGKREITRALKL